MDEYLVDIFTDAGKDTIKTYGSSVIDVVNSMVDLTFVQDINEITRAKDQKSWSFSKKSSLQELRSLKALVRDKAQIKLHLAEDS
jgi:hypothetical protein|tara:strand:- start:479 stop:733 length:255 start_codon:yes stop_codon:yes gene_type:complete